MFWIYFIGLVVVLFLVFLLYSVPTKTFSKKDDETNKDFGYNLYCLFSGFFGKPPVTKERWKKLNNDDKT